MGEEGAAELLFRGDFVAEEVGEDTDAVKEDEEDEAVDMVRSSSTFMFTTTTNVSISAKKANQLVFRVELIALAMAHLIEDKEHHQCSVGMETLSSLSNSLLSDVCLREC